MDQEEWKDLPAMDQGEEMDQGGSYEAFDGPMDQKATKVVKQSKERWIREQWLDRFIRE